MSNLYRAVQVWRRTDASTSIRYSCLENLSNGSFCVVVADFVRVPLEPAVREFQDRNVVELLAKFEMAPEHEWFGSLADAIKRHDKNFGNA